MKGFFDLILKNAFFRNSVILFSGTMVVNVLNYVFHLAVGRMVDPSTYGEIESLISLLTIISVPAATLTLIATKYAATMKAKQDVFGIKSLYQYLNHKVLFYGVPFFVFALFLTPLIKNFLNIQASAPILFLWGVMFLAFLSAVTVGILTGWQRFADVNRVSIASTILKFFGAIILLKIGYGVSGVAGSFVLAGLFGYLISRFFVKKITLPESATQESMEVAISPFASVKKYALPAFVGTLSVAILGNADMIFAKHHLEAVASGEYGALSVVGKTIFFVTGVLTTVLFAMSAEEGSQSKKGKKFFYTAIFLTVLVSGVAILFFSLFPEWVLSILFGSKYLEVSPLLGWFALVAGVYSLANLFLQYLLSIHETRVTFFYLALSSLEIGALFFFGENFYAIIGITVVTQILVALVGLVFFLRQKSNVENDLSRHSSL